MNVSYTFPSKGFVYDLRKGQALGEGASASAALLPGDAAVFAIMPYHVRQLTVKPNVADRTVRYTVNIGADKARAGRHVVLIEVAGPDGEVRPHYGAKLAGRWTIRTTDFVSRVTGDGTFGLGR